MKNILLKSSIMITTLVALTGCGGTAPKVPVSTNATKAQSSNYSKRDSKSNTLISTLDINYLYTDTITNKPVTKKEFLQTLNRQLNYASGANRDLVNARSGVTAGFQKLKVKNLGGGQNKYRGREIFLKNSILYIHYMSGIATPRNGEDPYSGTAPFMTISTFKIPYNLQGTESKFSVKTTYPKSYITVDNSISMTNAHMPLAKPEYIQRDALLIFEALPTIKILRSEVFEGEVNLTYSVESVKATLKRELYSEYGLEYAVKYNDKEVEVNIEVVPYKNGSKVSYSFELGYYLLPNGTMTIKKSDSDKINALIKKAINS